MLSGMGGQNLAKRGFDWLALDVALRLLKGRAAVLTFLRGTGSLWMWMPVLMALKPPRWGPH